MFNSNELMNNINITEYNLQESECKCEVYGYCRYILELSRNLMIREDACYLAMMYLHKFYINNLFVNYDKRLMSCAALLLACKVEDYKINVNEIIRNHLFAETTIFKDNSVITQNEIKDSIQKVCSLELKLLKVLNFKVRYNKPLDFLNYYTSLLFPEHEKEIMSFAKFIERDSYFTYVNNLFLPYTVALACLHICCSLLEIKDFTSPEFNQFSLLRESYLEILNSNSCNSSYYTKDKDKLSIYSNVKEVISEEYFNLRILEGTNELSTTSVKKLKFSPKYDDSWYDALPWDKKLHPYFNINDFYYTVSEMLAYYEYIEAQKKLFLETVTLNNNNNNNSNLLTNEK